MDKQKVISLLKKEMKPALGVTELSTIALACSTAYQYIKGELESINIISDPGLFKNAFSCEIPGTNEIGIEMAALLGVFGGDPNLKLGVLRDINEDHINKARKLKKEGIVKSKVRKGITELFIDVIVKTNNGIGRVIIKNTHTNIVKIEINHECKYQKEKVNDVEDEKEYFDIRMFKLKDFKNFVDNVTFSDIKFVLRAIKLNKELLQEGIRGRGMKVGPGLETLIKKKKISDDLISYAQKMTGFAVDARMGGVSKPAMSICGSGVHGIVSTIPLLAVAEKLDILEEKLARAIVLSYLITIYIKNFSGRLSAFCGCAVAAGTGASAGVVYLLNGGLEQINNAINNMAASITGIICDGGNYGCSLKAIVGAGTAVLSALLAMEGIVLSENSGIIGKNVEETMKNMGLVSYPGMVKTNDTIIKIMTDRIK